MNDLVRRVLRFTIVLAAITGHSDVLYGVKERNVTTSAWWGKERNIKPGGISLKAKIFISSEFYLNKSGWANTMEKL